MQKDLATNTVIYDFGANNGDDIPYYLMKAAKVVAVEANPQLCDGIRARFFRDIEAERLFVENCVLTEHEEQSGCVDFYIHKQNDVLSQFPRPDELIIKDFERVSLPQRSPKSLIQQHGNPLYVKIDIEHYDAPILMHLFKNNICPPFISAEAHGVEVFALLVGMGGYNSFKLVDGQTVSEKFSSHPIAGGTVHSFPPHSAGPFGEDIPGQWISAEHFMRVLVFEGMGWKDIHATSQAAADPKSAPSNKAYFIKAVANRLPNPIRKIMKKVLNGYLPR